MEISVKTFFGHELKVIANADGSYSITTKGLKGLIDKILLPIFSKELDTRKAEIVNDDIYSDAKGQIDKGKLKSRNDLLNFLGKKGINTDNLPYNDTIKLTKLLDLVDANDKNKLTEEELALIKKDGEEVAFKKEKAEEGFIEKMSNIIPKGYRVTSSKMEDKIEGDGNCFYRAIRVLEGGDQKDYNDVRGRIAKEIGKIVTELEGLKGKSKEYQDEKLKELRDLIRDYYGNEGVHNLNSLEGVITALDEIKGTVMTDKEYAGSIEAYFYAKAANKVVIIYDSSNQVHVFIPNENGNSVHVKHVASEEIESCVKEKHIDITDAVKLAYNAAGKHYEAIVQDVKN